MPWQVATVDGCWRCRSTKIHLKFCTRITQNLNTLLFAWIPGSIVLHNVCRNLYLHWIPMAHPKSWSVCTFQIYLSAIIILVVSFFMAKHASDIYYANFWKFFLPAAWPVSTEQTDFNDLSKEPCPRLLMNNVDSHLSACQAFERNYLGISPVILSFGLERQQEFRQATTKERLLKACAGFPVRVSTANSHTGHAWVRKFSLELYKR